MKSYIAVILFHFFCIFCFAQQEVRKIEGAELYEEPTYYEIIFKTAQEDFISFYLEKAPPADEDQLSVLKTYIFKLFEQPEQKDFLLQFDDFSLYLVYEDKKVCIEIWETHDSDLRKRSCAYSYAEYLQLFGLSPVKRTF